MIYKRILFLIMFSTSILVVHSQKFAYVDSDYILGKMPEFNQAQQRINDFSAEWQQEIESLYNQIDQMYKDYQSEQILLTPEMKIKREELIIEKEKFAQALQQKYFGPEGDLYKKRSDLIKPIQDRIFNAIQQLAVNNKYSIIFDKSSDLMMLYSNPSYDKSDDVLQLMGY